MGGRALLPWSVHHAGWLAYSPVARECCAKADKKRGHSRQISRVSLQHSIRPTCLGTLGQVLARHAVIIAVQVVGIARILFQDPLRLFSSSKVRAIEITTSP